MDRRTLYVDIDDTIIMHDLSAFPDELPVEVINEGRAFLGILNKKNIGVVQKFYKLGYDIYFWSKTGATWAELVARMAGLGTIASGYLTKPDFYMDDKDVTEWMGPRVYRECE